MVKSKLKIILTVLGNILSVIGLAFIASKLSHSQHFKLITHLSPTLLIALILLILLYSCLSFFLVRGWQELLSCFNVNVTMKLAFKIYGTSQLAKYIPGNLFNYINRQLIGIEAGIPAWPLVKSSFWELVIISSTASIFILLVLPFFYPMLSAILFSSLFVIGLTVGLIVIYFINPNLGRAVISYAVFLTLTGIIFATILTLTTSANIYFTPFIIGTYVVAWLMGVIMPGSPAGIGVRELALFTLLNAHVPQDSLLITILLSRLVTVGGDVIFYISAHLCFIGQSVHGVNQNKRI